MSILVFLKSNKTKSAIIWAYFCLIVVTWGIGVFIVSVTVNKELAYFGWQFANICTILSPVLFYNFIIEYFKLRSKKILIFAYIIAAIFLAINFLIKEAFLGDLVYLFDEFYYISWSPRINPSYLLFIVLFYGFLLTYSFLILIKNLKISTGIQRNQIKYLLLGSIIGWLGAQGDFLTVFNPRIYPISNSLIAVYPIIITYAIVRHQLLDINVVIKKSLVYSILIATITLAYLLIVLVAEKFLRDMMGYSSFFVSAFMAFLVGIFFFPLRNKIQYTVDRSFFKGTQAEIAEQNVLLRREVEDKEKFKAVATMASGMAHEIRNPLTAIKTFAEYLPVKKDDPLFLDNFSRIVGKEVERINSLVTNLLEFSRPLPLQIKEIDIHALLDEVLNYLNNELIRFKIKVEKNFGEGNPLALQADPNQLRQVFLNLFINAIQAMPQGGMLMVRTSVGAGPSAGPHGLSGGHRGPPLQIIITDTGCGIDPKDLKHIFDPFFTKKEKGTGLGLAIVQGIIEDHKGKIRVESEVGKGTSFVLEFPASKNLPLNP